MHALLLVLLMTAGKCVYGAAVDLWCCQDKVVVYDGPAGTGKTSARKNLELIRNATTEEQVLGLWREVMTQALNGCAKSQRLALEYLMGKAPQSVSIDADGGAMQLFAVAMTEAMEKA